MNVSRIVLSSLLAASLSLTGCGGDSTSDVTTPDTTGGDTTGGDTTGGDTTGGDTTGGDTTGGDDTTDTTPFLNQVLSAIGTNVILVSYANFETKAAALVTALADYNLELDAGTVSTETRENVQNVWVETMTAWQFAEVLQLGPAAPLGGVQPAVGAMGLRDEIYSWPLSVNRCRVDQELVEEKFGQDTFFQQELNNVYGLDASEYLIFATGTDNTCPPQATINSQGTWAQLSSSELELSRAAYAWALSENILSRADELHAAWDPEQGNFLADFAGAGLESSSVYSSAQEALNDLSDAIFYVEKTVKDYKLARPAGIFGCSADTCPENVESLYSRMSREAIIANLQAAHQVFTGGADDALGLEDYVKTKDGGEEIVTVMVDSLSDTVVALEAIDGSLYDTVAEDSEACPEASTTAVCIVYYTLKGFTDRLKTNFLEVMDLELPASATGDSD